MTERDYILVSNLARARSIKDLLGWMHTDGTAEVSTSGHSIVCKHVTRWIMDLEEAIGATEVDHADAVPE